jgi:hypothetical protein
MMPSQFERTWVVRPGMGLDDLLFGSSLDDVRYDLGEPEDVSEDLLGLAPTIAWYYWDLGVSAHFDAEDDFRLGTLQIEREDAELFGHSLIGMRESEARAILGRLGLGPAEFEVMRFSDFPTMGHLIYADEGLNFWFKHGRLESIQWGYRIGPDDQVCWPEMPHATEPDQRPARRKPESCPVHDQ